MQPSSPQKHLFRQFQSRMNWGRFDFSVSAGQWCTQGHTMMCPQGQSPSALRSTKNQLRGKKMQRAGDQASDGSNVI